MSAMETCKDERRDNLVPYAPRRRSNHTQDDGSILPILQRLSRGHDAEYDANVVVPLPAERIDTEPQRGAYWPLLICSVLSAGVSAVVVVVSIGWFGSGAVDERQATAIDPNPKSVQTVSFTQANNQTTSLKQNKMSGPTPAAGGETRVAKDRPTESGHDTSAAVPELESASSSDPGAEQTPAPSAAKAVSLSSHGWQESSAARRESSPDPARQESSPPPASQTPSPAKQESSSAENTAPKSSETAGGGEASKTAAPSRREPSQSRNDAPRHHSRQAHSRSRTHHARRHAPRHAQGTEPAPSTEAAAQPAQTSVWRSTWQTVFGHPEPPPSGGTGH